MQVAAHQPAVYKLGCICAFIFGTQASKGSVMYICVCVCVCVAYIYIYRRSNGIFSSRGRVTSSSLALSGTPCCQGRHRPPPSLLPVPRLCARAPSAAAGYQKLPPLPGAPCQRELTPFLPVGSEEHCSPHFPLPPVCHHCRVAELQPPAPRHIRTQRAVLLLPALSCSAYVREGGCLGKVSAGKEGDSVSFL